ncbi:MAG: M28 family peptidase [Candidatus Rokubacteria bacterium]|nr:M28 family peptidase [Candidatus Rokubacteria bacterium]
MARTGRLLVALAVALGASAAGAADLLPDPARLLGWVRDLASPAMEGRAAGTPGADRAAAYLADHFRRLGLRPLGEGGGYLQPFPVLTRVRLGADNRLEVAAPGAPGRAFAPGADFLPFTFSEDGEVTGEVVFAGYGISAPPLGYDDYAGLDVRGKVALVMTGEPQEQNPRGPFRAPEHFHYTELRHKVLNAREHGAAAIVVVESPGRRDDAPRPIRGTTPAWGIAAVNATRAVADALLGPAGPPLAARQAEIDRALAPRSGPAGSTARLRVALVREHGRTANVVGLLPGTDPGLRDEVVVLGGHYDHLGRGSPFSLDAAHPDEIHPGADDNASGTAAVIGLAEAFARAGGTRRSLVFVAFSGEELGLLGSTHYVRQPPVPIERTVAMVNLDSVGRMKDGQLYVMGVDTGQGLRALVQQAAAGLDVTLHLRGDGIGPSDHTAFVNRDRPVVFFFTGAHGDYHRSSDTWDKVDADGLRKVVAIAYYTVRALADREDRPAFVRVAPAAPPAARGGGYGPYFGSVPDFAESSAPGVRLSGVRPGSPADRAGLQPGDVIVRFAGVAVRTLDELTFALRRQRPGDVVEVVYVRGGAEHAVQATLESRR